MLPLRFKGAFKLGFCSFPRVLKRIEEDGDRVWGGEYRCHGLGVVGRRSSVDSVPEGLEGRGLEPKHALFCCEETWAGCPIDHIEEQPASRPCRIVSWGRKDVATRPRLGIDGLGGLGNGREGSGSGAWLGPVHQTESGTEKQLSRRNWARLCL